MPIKSFDHLDRSILTELQQNARLTNVELADRIGLSPSACHRRVANLERDEVIHGYQAELNPAKIGYAVMVLAQITLSGQSSKVLAEFEKAVMDIPNLLACFLMAGAKDYILRIAARDVADYGAIHTDYLSSLPHVQSIESNFVLRTVINRNIPVTLL